jgi:tellurite resistance protein TerC
MDNPYVLWGGFHVVIALLLLLDLGVFHHRLRAISVQEALKWSALWIILALLFNGFIYWVFGWEKALQFFTGYLVEKSLSVDNLFVFLLLFSYFKIPSRLQHKVLFFGIIGALILRISLILAGLALIEAFHWITYVLGAFLCVTGIQFALQKKRGVHFEPIVRFFRRALPVTEGVHRGRFILKVQGKWVVTPLLLALVVIEVFDLVFALDSIPAVFAITMDPFLVYTSNVFAILGMRSLYCALAPALKLFPRFKFGLGAILFFTGLKMFFQIPVLLSLGIIVSILVVSIYCSRVVRR